MSLEALPRTDGQHLSEDERDRAMLVLAMNGSHAGRAARQLASEGLSITERSLQNYRHTERYQQIRKTQAAEIERSLVERYRDAARVNVELGIDAALAAHEQLEAGELKEPAKVAQQAMVASGIALDKAFLADGRPTVITHNGGIDQIVGSLARRMGFDVDSTAVEEPGSTPLLREGSSANAQGSDGPSSPAGS